MPHADRVEKLAKTIFSDPIFHRILHSPELPPQPTLFKRWDCENESTINRRLQTVKAWQNYFLQELAPQHE